MEWGRVYVNLKRRGWVEIKELWFLLLYSIFPVTARFFLWLDLAILFLSLAVLSLWVSPIYLFPVWMGAAWWRIDKRFKRPLTNLTKLTNQVVQNLGGLRNYQIKGQDEFSIMARSLLDLGLRTQSSSLFVRQTHNRIDQIFNSIGEAVVVLDAQLTVIQVNQIFRGWIHFYGPMLGYPLLEIWKNPKLGQELRKFVVKVSNFTLMEDPSKKFEEILLVEGLVLEGNYTRIVNVKVVTIFEDSRFYFVLLLFDMTQIHQTEAIRKEFFANVNHELKTPIAAIRGYAEILLDFEVVEANPKIKEFLKVIETNSLQLQTLIDEMLNLTDLESKKLKLLLSNYSFKERLPLLMATLLPKAQKAKVQLHLDCPASIEPVRLDSQRIDSVVLNLIDNAIKYNHSGGWVKISIRQTLEFTFIYVEDNGPGIPEQVQHRVFERFFRVDKSHTRLGGGFGLGLAIVKHIVHAHGGQIYLKSELKSGTVFTVRLPRQVSEEMIDNRLQL